MKNLPGYKKINHPGEFLPSGSIKWRMPSDMEEKSREVPDYCDRFLIAMIIISLLFVFMILYNTPLLEILLNEPVHAAGNTEITEIMNQ